MEFEKRISLQEQNRRIDATVNSPLQRFLDIKISEIEPGFSSIDMLASENTLNSNRVVHGGVIYAMLDVAAYMALLQLMTDDQNAVTHDIFVNILKPSPEGKTVVFKGRVLKTGKRLAFIDSEAWCDGELVATGRVTKSFISFGSK